MCIEVKLFMTMRHFFGVLSIYYGVFASMVVVGQMQSPCPGTFEYENDLNGGMVGVTSFQQNVELEVQLSLGNQVNGYIGSIEVTTPEHQLRKGQPIQYKVHFPRWTRQPPKITKIRINGQTVCSGPPIQYGFFTTINLSHRLFIPQHQHLSFQESTGPQNNALTNTFDQFTIPRQPSGTKSFENPYVQVNYYDTNENRFQTQNPNLKQVWRNGAGGSDEYIWDIVRKSLTPTSTISKTPEPVFLPTDTRPRPPFGESTPYTEKHTRPSPGQQQTPQPTRSYSPSSSPEQCGLRLVPNPLVYNGKSIEPGSFPWLAAMFVRTDTGVEYRCCGSLVSHKHIITAAHCLKKGEGTYKSDDLNFFLGIHNLDDILSVGDNERRVKAGDYKIHPEYVPRTADADIAVVILAQDVPYTHYIRPICLWSESDDLEDVVGKIGTVVGWGKKEGNNTGRIKEPKLATGMIVSQEDCLRSNPIFRSITSHRSFCAGDRNNSGPCNGDSGSGFIMNRNGIWSLRGIVSISATDNSEKPSCDLFQYVAYTDVSKFRHWILSIINNI